MRRLWLALAAMIPLLTLVPIPAAAANTFPTNPAGFSYVKTTNLSPYSRPTGMLIAGACNRYAPEFAQARANGGEVLVYLNFVERHDSTICALDDEFYGGPPGNTPLWPFPTYGQRVNWPNTHMLDIRAGLAWADRAVTYIENLMREDRVDGVFLDVVGARLWSSLAAWDSWPAAEQSAWTAGTIDFVRRLDAKRRAINPRFIVVNNNTWDTPGTNARTAEQYVDGISIEHHASTGAYHQKIAGYPYSNLGHRRVIAIATSTAEAQNWANVQGVTHVSDQSNYLEVTPPPIGFHRLTDRPKTFGRTSVATTPSSGMTANQKRGSKFTLADKATLLGFSAYLDGLGATTGSQAVRIAIYKDSNGVPAGRWAQSNVVTIPAGKPAGWVNFTSPATPLDPGQWWLVIHTGDTGGVARNRGDGTGNWYGLSTDPFSDGASNPFGTGTAGNGTLSIKATHTVGY